MRAGLWRRLRSLQKQASNAVVVRRSLAPEWLLEEWRAQGLAFDSSDDNSIRRAIRMANLGDKEISVQRISVRQEGGEIGDVEIE